MSASQALHEWPKRVHLHSKAHRRIDPHGCCRLCLTGWRLWSSGPAPGRQGRRARPLLAWPPVPAVLLLERARRALPPQAAPPPSSCAASLTDCWRPAARGCRACARTWLRCSKPRQPSSASALPPCRRRWRVLRRRETLLQPGLRAGPGQLQCVGRRESRQLLRLHPRCPLTPRQLQQSSRHRGTLPPPRLSPPRPTFQSHHPAAPARRRQQ